MLDKIKKLLRLAGDRAASPAEAANAMRRALELADKAGISLDHVNPNDEDTGASSLHHDTATIAGFGDAEKMALNLVLGQFRVTPFLNSDDHGKRVVQFIGSPDACQIARYAFVYLVRVIRAAWGEVKDKRIKRAAFIKGFGFAIRQEMPRAFATLPENALVESTHAYIKNHLIPAGAQTKTVSPKLGKSGNSEASQRRGYFAGKNKGIRNGLKGGSTKLEG